MWGLALCLRNRRVTEASACGYGKCGFPVTGSLGHSLLDPRVGLQLPAGRREREGTRGKGAGRAREKVGGAGGKAKRRGRGSARLSRCSWWSEEAEARGPKPRGTWTASGARAGVPGVVARESAAGTRPPYLQVPSGDTGEPGARRGCEVEQAGAANAKLAGAAVPVCARGRAAPLAAAALPAARPRLGGRPGR